MKENFIRIPLCNFDRKIKSNLELLNAKIVTLDKSPINDASVLCKYALDIKSLPDEKPRRTLDRALIIFKLFRDDVIYSNMVLKNEKIIDQLPHYTHWINLKRGTPVYKLTTAKDEEAFSNFWREYCRINPINFAASKFHKADFEPYHNDQLINYVEALEYLLVPNSDHGEITYKLKTRGCLILSNSQGEKERKKIFKNLGLLYSIRSAIVHGGNLKTKSKPLDHYLEMSRNYARRAIQFFFQHGVLDDAKKRRELIENELLFKSKIFTLN